MHIYYPGQHPVHEQALHVRAVSAEPGPGHGQQLHRAGAQRPGLQQPRPQPRGSPPQPDGQQRRHHVRSPPHLQRF